MGKSTSLLGEAETAAAQATLVRKSENCLRRLEHILRLSVPQTCVFNPFTVVVVFNILAAVSN